MKGGKRNKTVYYERRDRSLNFHSECMFMSDFDGSTKVQLEMATHQNIMRGRGDGVPTPETAVTCIFAASAKTNELITGGRKFTNDTSSPFLTLLYVSVYISGVWT
jgi:hypothetical protein